MTNPNLSRNVAVISGMALTAALVLVLALPAVVATQPTVSDITSNKNATAAGGSVKITQHWAQGDTVRAGATQIEYAACKSNESVVGGGYQISGPDGVVLFAGPSLQFNEYAIQLMNKGDSTMEVQVYATCAS